MTRLPVGRHDGQESGARQVTRARDDKGRYGFDAMPRPYFGPTTPIGFAHRGGAKRWPENTLLAFRSASDLGYVHIETDIHETSDGHFVCFHDPTLERTTDGRGNLRDCTLAELKRLDAGHNFVEDGSYTFRGAEVRIPTLEEALEAAPDVHYTLEIKPEDPRLAQALWERIEHYGIHDRVLVASAHDEVIDAFRKHSRGRVATSSGRQAAIQFWAHTLGGASKYAIVPFDALQIPPSFYGRKVITQRFVEAAHHHGIQIHVWTINDPVEMEQLLQAGVDGVMTDVPDVLLGVLAKH
ncbi:MAG: glycerophosphodiester phosphodiesterase [Polyangiales bacterium]